VGEGNGGLQQPAKRDKRGQKAIKKKNSLNKSLKKKADEADSWREEFGGERTESVEKKKSPKKRHGGKRSVKSRQLGENQRTGGWGTIEKKDRGPGEINRGKN